MTKKNRKIVGRDGMDRISNFPDDLLVRILPLVPIEQAVTASYLSQRWKSLWTLLPELDFHYVSFCKSFGIVLEHRKKERFRGFFEFAKKNRYLSFIEIWLTPENDNDVIPLVCRSIITKKRLPI
ncbi:hypothetical protein MKW92_019749 [Papaver armeniacum]|nr:hypothetical protein MKW92_019749 [Papaver armeniacum]